MISNDKVMSLIEQRRSSTHLSSTVFHSENSMIDISAYDLTRENDRLQSFIENGWSNSYVSKEDLALIGFYFFKPPDFVKCIFCHVIISQFEQGDIALREHRKFSPNCPLIVRRPTDNVPISAENLDKILPAISFDECGPTKSRKKSRAEEEIVHSQYKLIPQRLKSFSTWPVGIKQRPQELAEAGFFYSGQSDLTICFACGVHIAQWEPNDNVWLEHKKHNKKDCSYLKLNHETVKLNEKEFLKLNLDASNSQNINAIDENLDKKENNVNYESLCKVCLERKSSIIFLPCRHVAVCGQCVFGIDDQCPICRTNIEEKINLYYA